MALKNCVPPRGLTATEERTLKKLISLTGDVLVREALLDQLRSTVVVAEDEFQREVRVDGRARRIPDDRQYPYVPFGIALEAGGESLGEIYIEVRNGVFFLFGIGWWNDDFNPDFELASDVISGPA